MPLEAIHAQQKMKFDPHANAVAFSNQIVQNGHRKDEQKDADDKVRSKIEISQSILDKVQQDIKIIHDVSLQFSVHEATGRTVVKVIEEDTGKLIREIPPHEILNLAAKIQEMLGILFNQKV